MNPEISEYLGAPAPALYSQQPAVPTTGAAFTGSESMDRKPTSQCSREPQDCGKTNKQPQRTAKVPGQSMGRKAINEHLSVGQVCGMLRSGIPAKITVKARRQAVEIVYLDPLQQPFTTRIAKSNLLVVPNMILVTIFRSKEVVIYTFKREDGRFQFIMRFFGGRFGAPCATPCDAMRSVFKMNGVKLEGRPLMSLNGLGSSGLNTPAMRNIILGFYRNMCLNEVVPTNPRLPKRTLHPSDIPSEEALCALERFDSPEMDQIPSSQFYWGAMALPIPPPPPPRLNRQAHTSVRAAMASIASQTPAQFDTTSHVHSSEHTEPMNSLPPHPAHWQGVVPYASPPLHFHETNGSENLWCFVPVEEQRFGSDDYLAQSATAIDTKTSHHRPRRVNSHVDAFDNDEGLLYGAAIRTHGEDVILDDVFQAAWADFGISSVPSDTTLDHSPL